ncbi:M48 family metallopeptidase [Phenylobacterium sp. J367]|uniref:tetratricopeptide repeat protein n=1 Tax=Phenylobacterium sp. J367 TaxID=2898435 RepID=UPI002151A3C9|nr:tetratricopeptide repeat protein [Phenylobacterium sp. J367]MCR5878641.1 tetratricopeptide repeat protein [Phenylobacterium sp. J367]
MRVVTTMLLAGLLATAGGAALAAGSGGTGGGGMPSVSGPQYDPAAEYAKAVTALQAKDYKAAARSAQRVTDAAPRAVDGWRVLGAAKAGAEDWKGSRKAYERAVKIAPDDVMSHAGLGLALANLKEPAAQAQLDWLKAKAQACGDTCPDAALLKGLAGQVERAMAGEKPQAALAPRPAVRGRRRRRRGLCRRRRPDQRAALRRGARRPRGRPSRLRPAPRPDHLPGLRLAQEGRPPPRRAGLPPGAGHRPRPPRGHRVLWRAEGRAGRPPRRPRHAGQARPAVRLRLRRGGGAAPLDRRRRRAAVLAAALAGGASLSLAADAPPLRAMRWLSPGADPVRTLATQPVECLRPPAGLEDALSVEIGRAAFRSPLVLGGQAARAGLSCESCHRNGRGNPDFLFPGASGPPGTADVTLSLFSSRRGNGVHDPEPIPRPRRPARGAEGGRTRPAGIHPRPGGGGVRRPRAATRRPGRPRGLRPPPRPRRLSGRSGHARHPGRPPHRRPPGAEGGPRRLPRERPRHRRRHGRRRPRAPRPRPRTVRRHGD